MSDRLEIFLNGILIYSSFSTNHDGIKIIQIA